MPGFDLSRRARGDLVEIGLYGAARWGDERLERYVSDLYSVFQRLVDDHVFGRRCDRLRPGLWREKEGAFLVRKDGSERPALTWLKRYVSDSLPTGTAR